VPVRLVPVEGPLAQRPKKVNPRLIKVACCRNARRLVGCIFYFLKIKIISKRKSPEKDKCIQIDLIVVIKRRSPKNQSDDQPLFHRNTFRLMYLNNL
jgi:hypothetical protein